MERKKTKVTPVALPVRGGEKGALRSLSALILPSFPSLRKKMVLADMKDSPERFMDKAIVSAFFTAVAFSILSFMIMDMAFVRAALLYSALLFVPYVVLSFFYFMMYPTVMVLKRKKEIEYELVFAVRHLLIGLRSGMPLFDAMVGVSRGYGEVSREFNKIVEKVTLGAPISQAIREVVQVNPSPAFRRIMVQLANSVGSGADVANALDVVLSQVFREQVIELKAYGQKLNPLIMFYMIFGIIFPSLGLAFAIILFSFLGSGRFSLNAPVLVLFLVMVAVVQFMFLSMVETSRPRYAF